MASQTTSGVFSSRTGSGSRKSS